MISIFNLTLAANEAREVAITGEYFELRNALYPVSLIELLDRSGGVISRLENPEQSDFVRPGRYETVRVTNGPTAQTIKHFYGTGDAGSRRTSGLVRIDGTSAVSVVDGGSMRSIESQAFAWASGAGALVGNYARWHLANPAASGKNVIVKALRVTVVAATSVNVHVINALPGGVLPGIQNSKYALGAAPVALSRYDYVAASTPEPNYVDYLTFGAAGSDKQVLQEPVVIPPGFAFTVENGTLNQQINAACEWIEALV